MHNAIKDPVQLASVDELLLLQLLLLLSCVVTVVHISCVYGEQINILHCLVIDVFPKNGNNLLSAGFVTLICVALHEMTWCTVVWCT